MFKKCKHMEDMDVLKSVNPDYLTAEQNRNAVREVNLIKLKRSRKLKGRMCDNRSPQHTFLLREE